MVSSVPHKGVPIQETDLLLVQSMSSLCTSPISFPPDFVALLQYWQLFKETGKQGKKRLVNLNVNGF